MARLRIRDIAEAAGVSPATVSRYLNNQPGQMSEETRQRIAQVIERTGYRPRTAARNLRRTRSGLIGVVMADVSNPYSSAMLEALAAEADARGYTLMTAFSGGDAPRERTAVERLIDAGADGLVVNACDEDDAAVAAAVRALPVVLLDRPVAGVEADLVTSTNDDLMAGLVAEMVRAGCARCELLTEEAAPSAVRRRRAEAFRAACAAAGLQAGVTALAGDAARDRAAVEALRVGAAAAPGVAQAAGNASAARADGCAAGVAGAGRLGLIAVNGLVLLRLVEALAAVPAGAVDGAGAAAGSERVASSVQGTGALPADLAVATFDDYPWNHVIFGGVTTAVQDTRAIARAVLERMDLRVELATRAVGERAHEEPATLEVPGRIASRASTAPRA